MISAGYLEDEVVGRIWVKPHGQATRFTFRCRDGELTCTCPVRSTVRDIQKAIKEMRPQLLPLLERGQAKAEAHRFTPDTRIDVVGFHVRFEQKAVGTVSADRDGENIVIYYKSPEVLAQDNVQAWLVKALERFARHQATETFLPRLLSLAHARGLSFSEMKISNAKGRWGSCSGRRTINLSLYLLLVPRHLQDYVMHHELTHLIEMNHGPRFWALLDQACGSNSLLLREELKRYDTRFV